MKITVAGGDLRMKTVRELFAKKKIDCNKDDIKNEDELLSAIQGSDAVILPTPCEKNGFLNAPLSENKILIEKVFSSGNEKTLFLGGMLPFESERFIDYSLSEEFLIKNAVATAEGALFIAMSEMKTTLYGANALTVGFGRIGNYLAKLLKELGAKTTVAARSEKSKAAAEISGHKVVPVKSMAEHLKSADVIFNTVPFRVFGADELSALKNGAFIIDLASLPGGVDKELAKKHQIKVIHALGLPGKYSPETAGLIVFGTVLQILRERGFSV